MTPDSHAQRKAKVYEAALALTSQGVSPAAMTIQQLAATALRRRTSASPPGLTAAARWSIWRMNWWTICRRLPPSG